MAHTAPNYICATELHIAIHKYSMIVSHFKVTTAEEEAVYKKGFPISCFVCVFFSPNIFLCLSARFIFVQMNKLRCAFIIIFY